MKPWHNSKKVRVTGVAIATAVLVNFLGLAPEMVDQLYVIIGVIAGSFNVGQGVADGLSGGKTSHVTAN